MKVRIWALAAWVLFASASPAAKFEGISVHGEIISSSIPQPGWMLELRGLDGRNRQLVDMDLSGSFVVHAKPGTYSLRIIGSQGQVVADEIVDIRNPYQNLSIRVPVPNAHTSDQSSVSVTQLIHQVPAKARKAFAKGQAAVRKQKNEEALKYFREAITIDPAFADAFAELGASLVVQGELSEGIVQFYKAISLVPDHETALYNLSITLGKMRRWEEAEDISRRALELNPDQPPVHFILGVSLMHSKSDPIEVLDHLLKSAPEVTEARLLAADVLRQIGRRAEAAAQLEEYLRVSPPDDTERTMVKYWLTQLQP